MPTTIDESNAYTQLRTKAEAQLEAGTSQPSGHWSMGVDALSLLYRLASNPENGEDALKLLHEMQVYQVELDLQHEEIASSERALAEDLSFYRELYDSAPIAYFLVDFEGVIIQANVAAAELLGVGQTDPGGQRIDSFLVPESRSPLLDLLQRVAKSGDRDSCLAEAGDGAGRSRRLRFLASVSARREYILLACCEQPGAG